jgi:nicotinate-nucleotide--dimethylbenzimidazole phosphoribosyltransferase
MTLLDSTIRAIEPPCETSRAAARQRIGNLTMPPWALGTLLDLAVDLAGMTGRAFPSVSRKAVVTMAGDHGVVAEGVSPCRQDVTVQMIYNFVNGGAGVNVLARHAGAEVVVVDFGVAGDVSDLVTCGKIRSKRVGFGTANFTEGPAMTREQALRSVEAGIEVALELAGETDLYGTGEMGIGNTTPSSAIVSAITGVPAAEVTGHGAGLDETGWKNKVAVIEKGLMVNRPDPADGIDVLAKVGGFEIGGIAGLILGAASLRKPVVVDGFISTAGALIAHALCPLSSAYMITSHKSVERGHVAALEHLGRSPLLQLNLRLGEGTGAALAMHLVEAAARVLSEMSTFEEAAVFNSHV